MGDWPSLGLFADPVCLSSHGPNSVGGCLAGALATTMSWPAANQAFYIPIRVPEAVTVMKLACGTGSGTTGNFDLGIYDLAGNRLVSTGSTAKTTSLSDRVIDVTDTDLLPGLYYLAMAVDTNAAAYVGTNAVSGTAGGATRMMGVLEQATAFPLPATATFATATHNNVPAISAYLRSE